MRLAQQRFKWMLFFVALCPFSMKKQPVREYSKKEVTKMSGEFHGKATRKGKDAGVQKMKGFTLLELLIAIVILGILAAMVVPRFTSATLLARCNTERNNIGSVNTQIELYNVNTNLWPEWPNMMILLASNTYFPDGAPRDPFTNLSTLGQYTLDMRGSPVRMRIYTESHVVSTTAPHADCSTTF